MNINAPNFGGLGLAAGNTNLNLTVPGALGLQAAGIAGTQKNAMLDRQQQAFLQMRQQNLLRDQMQQQAYASQQGNATEQQKLAFDQQRLAAESAQNAGTNDFRERDLAQRGELGRGDIDVRKAAIEQDKMAQTMKTLVEMDKKKLQETGAFAAYGLMALNGAKTPEEANMIRKEILKEAVAKGHRSAEEAAILTKMPLSQAKAAFAQAVIASGQAAEFQAANKTLNPADKSGIHATFEDGQLTELSVDPNAAVKSKTQGELMDRQIGLQQLSKIRDEFDPAQMTYAGKAGRGASAIAELSKGIPGVEQATEFAANKLTGKPADERAAALQTATGYLNSVEQFFNTYRKDITGAAAAEKELERLRASFINSDLSPSQFKGALDQLLSKYTSEAEFKKNVLREGVDTMPRNDLFTQARKDPKYADWSDDKIRRGIQMMQEKK